MARINKMYLRLYNFVIYFNTGYSISKRKLLFIQILKNTISNKQIIGYYFHLIDNTIPICNIYISLIIIF